MISEIAKSANRTASFLFFKFNFSVHGCTTGIVNAVHDCTTGIVHAVHGCTTGLVHAVQNCTTGIAHQCIGVLQG